MLAVLGRRAVAAAGVLPVLAQQARRCISTSQPAADLRNFLDEADPMTAAHGETTQNSSLKLSAAACMAALVPAAAAAAATTAAAAASVIASRASVQRNGGSNAQAPPARKLCEVCTVASATFQLQQEQLSMVDACKQQPAVSHGQSQ
jgi:hypothetical protein